MTKETRNLTAIALVFALFAMAFATLVMTTARSAAEECPPAETILDGFIEATGGADAYRAVKSKIMTATFEIPAQGVSGTLTIYHARPKLFRSTVEIPGIGTIDRGIAGDIAWESSMMTGPQIKEGPEKIDMMRDADFDAICNWRDIVEKAECTGLDTIEGTPCWRVEIAFKEGSPRTQFFDVETNLVVATASVLETQMGKVPLMAYESDYADFGGIKQARVTRIVVMGQDRFIKLTKVEYDAEMPEGIFDLPADVKALVTEE